MNSDDILSLFESNLSKKGVKPGVLVKRVLNSFNSSFYKTDIKNDGKTQKPTLKTIKINEEEILLYVGIVSLLEIVDEREIRLLTSHHLSPYYSYKFLSGQFSVFLPIGNISTYLIDFFINVDFL